MIIEDQHHINLILSEKAINSCIVEQLSLQREVAVLCEVFPNAGSHGILRIVENSQSGILYLRGDRKTEKHNHHDRHHQQDQHRALIAEDMIELFSDK